MKVTDYFNQPLEDITNSGWNKLRKKAATGMTFLMLSGAGLGIMNKPSYATPSSAYETVSTINNDDQSIWERMKGVFKKKKEIVQPQQKKPVPIKKKAIQIIKSEDYVIKPLEIIIDGEAPKYVREGEKIVIPFDRTFSVTPQVNKAGMRTEFLLKLADKKALLTDLYQTDDKGYITDRFGNKIAFTYGKISLGEFAIAPGERLKGQITYETMSNVLGTAEVELQRGEPEETAEERMITPEQEEL